MKEGLCLSQEACNEMISGVTELVGSVVTNLHRSVKRVCAAREEMLGEIDGVFEDQSCVQPFTGITSQYHQRKHFIEKFGLQEPSERRLGQSFVRKYRGASSRLVPQGDFCYDVDLLSSIQHLLQIESVVEQIENGHFSSDTVMSDVCDGQIFQSHPLFTAYPQALQIILYYDDLEICNPLGSNVKKHKIGAFYFTLGNLKPRNRSLLHTIQLVALAKSSVIQTYGINSILEPFMASIRQLEMGHDFVVRDAMTNMRGTLLLVSADNLASHVVGGYKALHAALRKCRYCLATGDDMKTKFTAEDFQSRSRDAHGRYVQALAGPNPDYIATTYGVIQDSVLNSSEYFHVVDGLPPDVLHDILEGILQYEVKLLLRYLIHNDRLFTLDQLNQRLQSFDYGYHTAKDKPSVISSSRLNSTEGNLLGQSATKMWCLGRVLPLVVGQWVPEDEQHYGVFLVLRNILDICMAPVTSVQKAAYLRSLIDEHHQMFKQCYPEASFIPKMHYMVHLPQWIVRIGPLVRLWTMRFEGRHKLFKKLSTVMGNFLNAPKSLAHRYQEYQCYHLLNKDNYFREETTVGNTEQKIVKELWYKDKLKARLPSLRDDDVINTAVAAEVMGTMYKKKCCVVIGSHLQLPQFGQVQDMVIRHPDVYFVIEVLNTIRMNNHYYSYEISHSPNNPQFEFRLPSELPDYQVLHIHHVMTAAGSLKFIVPKYDIDLCCQI